MENYKNFGIGSIVWAYYLIDATEEQMQKDIEYFLSFMPLNKAYLENHRGLVDVPQDKMRLAKKVFERNGIKTAGCITSTGLVGERKTSIFDTYCYTSKEDREAYVKIVEELAEVVDEIILDDYFFCSCRCEKCIQAKGERSWSKYRLDLMEDFSKVITSRAKAVNPKMNFIIKYPNWYESWQETGYNPEKQKDIFDMVYSGTETRDPVYTQQHLQRYHSYSIFRYLENIAPGRNGGGWIDPFGAEDNLTRWFEQADFTMLAGAPELMLFNYEMMLTNDVFTPLGKHLRRVDAMLDRLGTPKGVSLYEPYNGDGEDLLHTYLGMGGIPFEMTPYFDEKAPVVFMTESASVDTDIMPKVEQYVRNGGNAIVTIGFLKSQYEKGIKEMTSLRLTGRHLAGDEYYINLRNHTHAEVSKGKEKVSFELLTYKTNATWADVSVVCGEYNFPLLSEDNYGKGRLFVLNLPDNFADLYKLPMQVWAAIGKMASMGQEIYIASDEKVSLFAYDNDCYAMYSFTDKPTTVRVYVRNNHAGVEDLEDGSVFNNQIPQPKPSMWFDGCTIMPEEEEYAVDVPVGPGTMKYFKIRRNDN